LGCFAAHQVASRIPLSPNYVAWLYLIFVEPSWLYATVDKKMSPLLLQNSRPNDPSAQLSQQLSATYRCCQQYSLSIQHLIQRCSVGYARITANYRMEPLCKSLVSTQRRLLDLDLLDLALPLRRCTRKVIPPIVNCAATSSN